MSRYLSPSKICLVILINLYRNNEAQASAGVTLLSFISSHILRRQDEVNLGSSAYEPQSIRSLKDFEKLLSPLTSRLPGRSLYPVFLRNLWRLQCLDDLELLFEQSFLSDDPRTDRHPITQFSPIGQYLRRCQLEYVRLQFGDAQQLWEDLQLFREPSRAAWAVRNSEAASMAGGLGTASGAISLGEDSKPSPVLLDRLGKRSHDEHELLPSQDELERMVHFQLEHLQTYGCRVPDELSDRLRKMVDHSTTTSADVHFVRFFDAWRSGAYAGAIDHIHRYFDYALEGQGQSQNVKTYHQYALLHLAVLHADFGCFEEAIAAMNECIATARENQDTRCLNFGLSWLVHLRKSHPEYAQYESLSQEMSFAGTETDILAFLQYKALESKDYVQLSSAILAQAEAQMQDGGNITKAIELSYQSGHLNSKYSLRGLHASQTRLHGSLFGRAGQMTYASQQYSIANEIYSLHTSKPEMLSMECTQAYIKALAGRYEEAMSDLAKADPAQYRTLRMDNLYLGFANMIRLKQAIHRDEDFASERFLRQLRPLRKLAEPDTVFETHVLEIELLQKQDELAAAFDKIQELIDTDKNASTSNTSHRIKLLILKANLWARSGKPSKGFSVALRAASSAYDRLLLPLLWEAVAALATILIDLGEFEGARKIVDGIMPHALEGVDMYLVGRLYSILTDALVGLAGESFSKGSKDKDTLLNIALVYLARAKEAFDRVEDVEGILSCLDKRATLFRHRGEDSLAEEMDGMYDAVVAEARRRDDEARGLDV